MEHKNNEIDLLELLIKTYLYLKKYWWIFVIAIILGGIFTLIKNHYLDKNYKSSMILSVKPDNDYMYALTLKEFNKHYEKNPAEIINGIIEQSNELIKNGNFDILAKKMNLNNEYIKGLKSVLSEYRFEKGEAPGNSVKITVNSSNQKVFNKLGEGLLFLINNNSFVKKKNTEDSLMLINIINKTDVKIHELDSLQSKFLKNGKVTDLFIFKDNSFFSESVKMNSLKEKLMNELKNLRQATLIEDFYLPKADKTNFTKTALLNIFIFVILAFFVIVFIIFNKKAKAFENKLKK